ncbi:MAG: metallophosphoesterase family protein [Acidimicrobiales bacterium]
MGPELTTVADDMAVAFAGVDVHRWEGLAPDEEHHIDGVQFRTLPTPPGERLAVVTTVNDVHFGETVCGHMDAGPLAGGPVFRSEPGGDPYPELMNRGAIAEMLTASPDAVVAKGDLTDGGTDEQYAAFLSAYGGAFGDRLHHIRGNHDAYRGQDMADTGPFTVSVPGALLAVIDTTIPRATTGRFPTDQAEWLDTVAAEADRPVLVFGHHHVWAPTSKSRPPTYFGISPDDSERLIEVVARRRSIVGYFAGHTHRNRVRRFEQTGDVPWVEVACVKDFPGAWAEYRIHEGGVLQVMHRISSPDALAWTEKTRGMFNGQYPGYAFGSLDDRCFAFGPR